ncbi:MAG: hypothetical protein KDD66_11570 [Bdellovibrionales bacterium]|nr:hypothetical protein [Bdellovibrionales bacterium]
MACSFKIHLPAACVAFAMLTSCTPASPAPYPGPDKQAAGTIYGAMLGAGAGAVYGAQVSAGAGPGAAVGAGFGAIYGMAAGIGIDALEEDQLRRDEELVEARERSWVQSILAEHYERRLELHPNRDIFPADLFFVGDEVRLRPDAKVLVQEIARLQKRRLPWSRLVIASYVTARDEDSDYAAFLNRNRADEIATEFVRAGIEPRRIKTRSMTIPEPILIDPHDSPQRYRQAIEIIPVDY